MGIEYLADQAEGIRVWLKNNGPETFNNTYSQFVYPIASDNLEEHLASCRYEPESYQLGENEASNFHQTSCIYANVDGGLLRILEFSLDIGKLEWKNEIEQFNTPMKAIKELGVFSAGSWESVLIFGTSKYGGWRV